MSEEGGPGVGDILLGIFGIVFGLCFVFVGGGCTILFIGEMLRPSGLHYGLNLGSLISAGFVLFPAGILVGGLLMLRDGVRRMRGTGPGRPPGSGRQGDG